MSCHYGHSSLDTAECGLSQIQQTSVRITSSIVYREGGSCDFRYTCSSSLQECKTNSNAYYSLLRNSEIAAAMEDAQRLQDFKYGQISTYSTKPNTKRNKSHQTLLPRM